MTASEALMLDFSLSRQNEQADEVEYSRFNVNEALYEESLLKLFGPAGDPKNVDSAFEPSLQVHDESTFDVVRPAVAEALGRGITYWQSVIKEAKTSLLGEQQLALHERALAYLNGDRRNPSSYRQVIEQMTASAYMYAERQRDQRIDELYRSESAKSPLFLGKLVYGKAGVLWNVGGSEIYRYSEDFKFHSAQIKMHALAHVGMS